MRPEKRTKGREDQGSLTLVPKISEIGTIINPAKRSFADAMIDHLSGFRTTLVALSLVFPTQMHFDAKRLNDQERSMNLSRMILFLENMQAKE